MKSFAQYLREYQEEPGSTFTDSGKQYDLNPLFVDAEGIFTQAVPISKLEWILNGFIPTDEDKQRIAASDPNIPLLVTNKGGRLLVVDGLHRLLKAKQEGRSTILVKIIPAEVMRSVREYEELNIHAEESPNDTGSASGLGEADQIELEPEPEPLPLAPMDLHSFKFSQWAPEGMKSK
jgi:hypothetical protein